MNFKLKMLSILVLFISFFPNEVIVAKTLDSQVLINELENSNTNIYKACIKKYDDYLKQYPEDVLVQIEKCKFIQNAQYDENEDYNPNQEAFDSCSSALVKSYPDHPEVLLYQTTYTWGDELKKVFEIAEKSTKQNPTAWNKENLSILYKSISDYYYSESNSKLANSYMQQAISKDAKYKTSLDYAKILYDLNEKDKALKVLLAGKDTTKIAWELSEKADLLLQLKSYSKALQLYDYIGKIDSTYKDNYKLANTFEGVKQYDLARKCLIADTVFEWKKESSFRNLLIHDIKYQSGDKGIESYNKYRDQGFLMDPLALYRLKVFFAHPLQAWKFRDLLSLLSLIASLLIIIAIPYLWILPVYFAGHKWNFIDRPKPFISDWGLKTFWFISVGYLLASFIAYIVEPEMLYSIFKSVSVATELSQEDEAFVSLVFLIVFGAFGFFTMYKVNPKILLSTHWTIQKSIFTSIGILLIYRIFFVGIYIRVGVDKFGLSLDDVTCLPNLFLASRQDVQALITVYGKWIGFLFICVLAPLYEEIVFRGVILGSCQRYTNFRFANIFQATLFATIHLDLYLFPIFLVFGILAGIMRKKSGGLLPGIVFHIGNNVLAILIILIK